MGSRARHFYAGLVWCVSLFPCGPARIGTVSLRQRASGWGQSWHEEEVLRGADKFSSCSVHTQAPRGAGARGGARCVWGGGVALAGRRKPADMYVVFTVCVFSHVYTHSRARGKHVLYKTQRTSHGVR